MKIKITLFCSACLLLFACNLTPPNAESLLVAALQNGNWNEVYNECVKDSTFKNPETLGLRGHACIILNKNNESYHCLNSMDSVQRKNWFNWTREFAKKHPKLPVSQYLFGDAHMRTGNKTEALQCFNRAVELDPAFALALNARATALALDSKFGEALKDASAACKYTEGVAEFLATLATINYKHMGAEGASSDFTKSLKISPDFSLALNGKACASLFNYHVSSEEFSKIFTDLQNKAARGLPIPLFRENGRLLMRELEKIKMPELHNTPFLAVSDFLDWYTLQQRTLQDEHDFIRYAIK
ncbi:MAG: tetratricopeptide repeat protein, partial [Saprospiraceae bacterium]|nr:tetratricopeptide repeat protein [Saprospiraceae bacterium]